MYTLIEVTTRQHETDFLELPVRLYKGNPWWIRPLDNDIRNVFDPAKNPCFQNGECIRWILKDEAGQCVGRVAAFINRKTCHLVVMARQGHVELANMEPFMEVYENTWQTLNSLLSRVG